MSGQDCVYRYRCGDSPGLTPEPTGLLTNGAVVARRGRVRHLDSGRVPLRGNEEIGRYSWAAQSIDLGPVGGCRARLSLFLFEERGNGLALLVDVNGNRFEIAPDSARQGAHFWRAIDLAQGVLLDGLNRVQVTSENLALNAWALGVAAAATSRGSAWSWNRGESWVTDGFGVDQSLVGDYAIRWWVDEVAPTFGVRSPVLHAEEAPISGATLMPPKGSRQVQRRVAQVQAGWLVWGPWTAHGSAVGPADALQFRVDMESKAEIEALEIATDVPVRAMPGPGVDLVAEDLEEPQLGVIRDELGIGDVVAGAATDVERAAALCSWIHQRWVHHSDTSIYSPWHAPTILAWQDAGSAQGIASPIGFCVHFAVVLTQLATAVGMRARGVIIGQMDDSGGGGHFVCEIWSRELQRWVCFDADFDYHWLLDGKPAGVVEVHEAWRDHRLEDLEIAKGLAFTRNPEGGSWPRQHFEGGGYEWFGLPTHQNWLADPRSRLMHHGAVNYHESDVLWFGAEGSQLRECYPLVSDQLDDFRSPGAS